MIGARILLTVAADLSANIFAAFLLVMIVVLALSGDGAAPAVPARLDAERDLRTLQRAPLGPAGLVAALGARRPRSGTVLVDLFADRVALRSAAGRTTVLRDGLGEIGRLAAAGGPAPVVLSVFDATRYGAATAALAASGIGWREISVPIALRKPGGGDWSPAFLDLAARPGSDRDFREGLARLLDGTAEPAARQPSGGGGGGAGGAAASATAGPDDLLTRLARLWRGIVTFVTLALVGSVMILAERRHRAARRPTGEPTS